MTPVPRISWDWFYDDDVTRKSTHMRVTSDHPDYPVIAVWRGNSGQELILRAQELIRDINEGRKTFAQAIEENAS